LPFFGESVFREAVRRQQRVCCDNRSMDREAGPDCEPDRKPASAPNAPAPLEPEDYYYENGYLVFTAAYHLKRGSCCGSGCRHCPYGNSPGKQLIAPQAKS
jgi:Family of unknown function (DUF5522)